MKTVYLVTRYEMYDRDFIEAEKFVTDDVSEYEENDDYEVEEIEYRN